MHFFKFLTRNLPIQYRILQVERQICLNVRRGKMNYYNEIKDTLIKNEIYKKAKDYSKNKSDLNSYYEVGRLLVEAQGGENRAKYGNKLIKEYSERLIRDIGKGYDVSNLKRMRQFYLIIQKGVAMPHQLTWSHIMPLLTLKDVDAIKYYIYIVEKQNIPYRELRERIKSKEYERIGYKEELSEPKVNTLIKEPIIINTNKIPNKINELFIHNVILEDMSNFLKQLGVGFTYVDHEVKIKIGNNYHYIDFLLYNVIKEENLCHMAVQDQEPEENQLVERQQKLPFMKKIGNL